ncbi:MAG: hypothetical protein KGS73_19695 [Chloroflexi bacterium]|nr:hypothetical protein [Chloroflexota bacterium]
MREQNETTTPQEVWQLLRELIEMQKESERRLQETERVLKESGQETERRLQETERVLKESSQETERLLKESERRLQETERVLKESGQETERVLKESGQETERRLQETERLLRESSQRVDAQMGKWGNRLGEFVEWQVRPAAVKLFQERGIDVTELQSNISVYRGAEEGMEIDLLAVNGTQAVAVEVKSKLTQQDVDEHLERLAKFKRLLPRYQTVNILGAVAAFVIPTDVARYAYQNGLFVIAQSGQNLVILNDSKFRPKAW